MRSYILFVIWSLVVGCGSAAEKCQYETNGIGGAVTRAWRDIPELDQLRLGRLVVSIREASRLVPSSAGATTSASVRDALAGSYLRAVQDLGGVPRHQGEVVLRRLLSPDSTACGGVSCARVFNVRSESVDPFLDGLMIKTGLSSALLQPANRQVRDTLLASLRPQEVKGPGDAFSQVLADISTAAPVKLPKKVPQPTAILARYQHNQRAGEDFVKAVKAYSGSDFSNIRMVEGGAHDTLKKAGISGSQMATLKSMVKDINAGLAKLPIVQETVYRGMKDVSREQIQKWRVCWGKGQSFGLGLDDKPGLSSASWDPEVAKKFMGMGHVFGLKHTYGVILEITDHQGVSIQTISNVLSEREVLIPSRMRFKIEKMSLLDQSPGIIHIKLRGIEQASRLRLTERSERLVA